MISHQKSKKKKDTQTDTLLVFQHCIRFTKNRISVTSESSFVTSDLRKMRASRRSIYLGIAFRWKNVQSTVVNDPVGRPLEEDIF